MAGALAGGLVGVLTADYGYETALDVANQAGVFGKKGSDIDKIKNNLSKFTTNDVSLNIKEVKKPETNAYLVAENIAQQLVKNRSK